MAMTLGETMKTLTLVFSLWAAAPGCFWVTTKSEGDALRNRLDAKEKALDQQIAQLHKVIDEATGVLKRNSADIGADVEQLRADIRTANGLANAATNANGELKAIVEKIRKDLEDLEQRVAQIETGKPSANSSAEDLWRLATQAFEAQRYADAADIYKRLTQSYPTHSRADDAQYFRGQAYSNLKDWDRAIGVYQQLVEKFPSSELADDGLYFAAVAAQQLKNCSEARTYLGLIRAKYPKASVTRNASDLEAQLKKDLKNKAKCSS
jgi:TolA-binding protein